MPEPERYASRVDMDNAHRTNMFLAQELNLKAKRLFRDWAADELDIDRLKEAIHEWFDNPSMMGAFMDLINRAEERKLMVPTGKHGVAVAVSIDPLKSKVFYRNLRLQMYMDFAQRFKNMGEVLSMLAWLVGSDRDKTAPQELRSMSDVLGL